MGALQHLLVRFVQPFNTESRFYWPLVIAVFIAIAANIAWYYWRQRGRTAPTEKMLRSYAVWINVLVLIFVLVLLIAKLPFIAIVLVFGLNAAALVYMYGWYLPPREAVWLRDERRRRYLPQSERKRRRKH